MVYRPQITKKINDLTQLQTPVDSKTALFIGTANWGKINEVVDVNSFSDFVSKFGTDADDLTLFKAIDIFYNNKGSPIKVYRIGDGTETVSTHTFQGGVSVDVLKFDAKNVGTYGNNIFVEILDVSGNRNIIVSDGKNREIYTNAGLGYATNESIAIDINKRSRLVEVTVESGQETINLVNTISKTFLTGGTDGTSGLADQHYYTAFDNTKILEYNYLLIPGKTDDLFQGAILNRLENRDIQDSKYSSYITGTTIDEDINTMISRTLTGKRAMLCAPSIKYDDVTGVEKTLDGSYLACAVAGVSCALPLNVSLTHESVLVKDLIADSTTAKKYYTNEEQERLLENNITPVSLLQNKLQIIRAVSRYPDKNSAFYEQIVVEEIDLITKQIEQYLDDKIGKPINESIRESYELNIASILDYLKNDSNIIDDYGNLTVLEGASPDAINVELSVKPTFSLNFIDLTINVTS